MDRINWADVARVGMTISAAAVLAFLAFLAWAVFFIGDDAEPQTLTDFEEMMRGE